MLFATIWLPAVAAPVALAIAMPATGVVGDGIARARRRAADRVVRRAPRDADAQAVAGARTAADRVPLHQVLLRPRAAERDARLARPAIARDQVAG